MKTYVKNILPVYESNFKDWQQVEKNAAETLRTTLQHLINELDKLGTLGDEDIEPLYTQLHNLQKARNSRINARHYVTMLNDLLQHQH